MAEALHRIAGRALKSRTLALMAVATFVAIVALRVPFPYIIAAAAQSGLSAAKSCRRRSRAPYATSPAGPLRLAVAPAPPGGGPGTLAWALPVALAALASARPILVDLGLFFSKLAVVTFGGAYAVLAYLADAAVGAKGWVTTAEMVDGLGLAETTPGPTIRQPVRRVPGRHRAPDPFTPLAAGVLGSLMTVWVTFAPSFVWIFAGAPHLERIVAQPRLAGALAAITAAVVGVVASLAVTFGLQVLFGSVATLHLGPLALPGPTSPR